MQTADCPWLRSLKKSEKSRDLFSSPVPNIITTTSMIFFPATRLCLFSFFFSAKFQNKLESDIYSGHTSCPIFLPSEHHSSAFILSLKLRYQTLWNQCPSNHVNSTPFVHLSSLTTFCTCFLPSLSSSTHPYAFFFFFSADSLWDSYRISPSKEGQPWPAMTRKTLALFLTFGSFSKLLEKIVLSSLNNHLSTK